MIQRDMTLKLKAMFGKFPVVSVLGPRQSGKTVLCRMTFPELPYVNLEDPQQRQFASEDPVGFLSNYDNGLILDEIQHVPELLSYIQVDVDEKRKNSLYLLTGSNQFQIKDKFPQSLAGRNYLLHLLPFSSSEILQQLNDAWEFVFKGGFPRIYDQDMEPGDFLGSYINNYIHRDMQQILQVRNLRQFEKFLGLCAGRSGQILNINSLANDASIDRSTVQAWLSVMEASSLIYFLRPYHKNFNKRIIKSPKLYFTDTGLASYLLGIQNLNQLKQHPLSGALFETMIISEFLKLRLNMGKRPALYYHRDNTGNEIDLIIENEGIVSAIEIKSSMTMNSSYFKNLIHWQKISKQSSENCYVIYSGNEKQKWGHGTFIPWNKIVK